MYTSFTTALLYLLLGWDAVIDANGGSKVFVGAWLQGPAPFQRNVGASFKPASTTKLFTAGAALEYLGPDYRFETRLNWRNTTTPGSITELTLIGDGDPSWGMSEFGEGITTRLDSFAQALKQQGVEEIAGQIQLQASDPRWDILEYPPGWQEEDVAECYGAIPQAFNLDINCAPLLIESETQVRWLHAGIDIPIRLQISQGAWTDITAHSLSAVGPPLDGFLISGTFKKDSLPQTLYLPVADMKKWILTLFEISLQKAGINRTLLDLPTGDPISMSFYSPPLSEILKPTMKLSLNIIADGLFKKMGSMKNASSPDLVTAGQAVLGEYLSSSSATLFDGSGVSRNNRVTPETLMTFLNHMKVHPTFPSLWESLPIAGMDGTLKNRMKNTPAQGVLRAKTGTLKGAYAMAGFVPKATDASVDYVPFVMLSDTTEENAWIARAAQDRVGAAFTQSVNP